MVDINSRRIDAKPRSKYKRYYGVSGGTVISGGGGGSSSSVDLSNFVRLTGETSQTVSGNLLATGDLVAYATSEHDITLPIAGEDSLGAIKVDTSNGLAISDDGTLSFTGATSGGTGGVSSWNDLLDKPDTFPTTWEQVADKPSGFTPTEHTHVMADITDFNGVTLDTDQTITGQKIFTKQVLSHSDIVAYATGLTEESFPIASSNLIGCIKVDTSNGLAISEDGTLSFTGTTGGGGGTVSEWGDISGTLSNQTDLWTELQKKANTADLNISNWDTAYNQRHTHSNKGVLDGIDSTDISNWNTAYNQRHTHNNLSVLSGITSTNISNWNNAANNSHYHNNKSVLDGIESTDVSHCNTALNNEHTHSNKSYLDNINQNLSTSSAPRFTDLTVGATNNVHLLLGQGSGNAINGVTSSNGAGNLYLNYFSSSNYTRVDANNNLTATGDIIAYSTGNHNASFPIATRSSVGCVKVGSGLNVTSDGTISVTGGTSSGGSNVSWGSSTNNVATLNVDGTSKQVALAGGFSVSGSGSQYRTVTICGNTQYYSLSGHTHNYAPVSHTHAQYISSISATTSGSGNAVTGITASGNVITAHKGNISGGSGSWSGGGTVRGFKINSMYYESNQLKGNLYLQGSNGTWEACQIMIENTYYSDYSRRWKIALGGSQMHVGDLVFNSDNGSSGSASVFPYYKVKIRRHGMSDAIQGAGAYTNSSDLRLKNLNRPYHSPISLLNDNTTEVDNSILSKISNLNSYYFNWKLPNEMQANSVSAEEEEELKQTEYYSREILGFVAQDLREVFPEFVYGAETDTEFLTIDYAGLGAVVAVEGLKELNTKLEQKVTELESTISNLVDRITILEQKLQNDTSKN